MQFTSETITRKSFQRSAAAGMLILSLAGCKIQQSTEAAPSSTVSPTASPSPSPSPLPTISPRARAPRPPQNPNVRLQRTLNTVLTPLGMPKLETDGKIGGQTLRDLCAVRYFSGHTATKSPATGAELKWLEAKPTLTTDLSGYIINKTCQVMGVKMHDKLDMLIPVSTARQGYSTPSGDFYVQYGRYGYHNSTLYPAEHGNGNMYYPQYFNGAVAVHGSPEMYASTTSPQSHGCVRMLEADAVKLWHLAGGPDHGKQDHYAQLDPIPVHVR